MTEILINTTPEDEERSDGDENTYLDLVAKGLIANPTPEEIERAILSSATPDQETP